MRHLPTEGERRSAGWPPLTIAGTSVAGIPPLARDVAEALVGPSTSSQMLRHSERG